MPTAQQYGMSLPAGTDLIRDGDNAITKNANATAAVLTRLESGDVNPQSIADNADLLALPTGWYYCRLSSTAATISNRPPGIAAAPFVVRMVRTSFGHSTITYYGYSGAANGIYENHTGNSTHTIWAGWRRLDNESVASSGLAGVANSLRVQEFRDAMGAVKTNGRGAIALRFDHGLANFDTKIRPLLEARNIPYSLALSSRNFNAGENAGVTAAMVDSWALAEVWNHGANQHQDQSSVAGLTDQIVKGKEELQAALPNKKIWGYAVPGTGGTGQGGFNGGSTVEEFYTTLAGDLILTNHAVSSGSFPGTARRVLDGRVRQGMAHFTIEAQTVARVKTEIDNAISGKTGNQLMMHPSLLDTAGYLTTAQLTEILDYIVSKRSSGELVVLSPYQMVVADAQQQQVIVKETAGRTVSVWDYLNNREQLIYGDTGARNILQSFNSVDLTAGRIQIRRSGSEVELIFYGVKPLGYNPASPILATLPAGFRPTTALLYNTPFYGTTGNGNRCIVNGNGTLQIYAWVDGNTVYGTLKWQTSDPWPTTLPGSPA